MIFSKAPKYICYVLIAFLVIPLLLEFTTSFVVIGWDMAPYIEAVDSQQSVFFIVSEVLLGTYSNLTFLCTDD